MKKIILLVAILIAQNAFTQVGIGTVTPDASSSLDVQATDKGILIPRVNITDLTTAAPITTPAVSLLVYNTNTTTGQGFYYWDGSQWTEVGNSAASTNWNILGNTGTNPTTNFIGTTDNQNLVFRTNNIENMRINTNGNIGIGTASNLARLFTNIPSTDATTTYGIYNHHDGTRTGSTYGIRNHNYSSTNSIKYGIYNYVNNEGTGTHYGLMNYIYMNNASNATGYGNYNYLQSYGTGNHRANFNYLNHLGAAVSNNNYASYNIMNTSDPNNTSDIYGEYTEVDYSTGVSYGEHKEMNTHVSYNSTAYGDYNEFLGTGNGTVYAVYNSFPLTGTGVKHGVYNNWAAINGTKYGTYNWVNDGAATGYFYGAYNRAQNQTSFAARYGMYNQITNNTGIAYGAANNLDRNTGAVYGSWNDLDLNEGTVYGTYNYISQPATSTSGLYGERTYIVPSTGTAPHYGLYMNIPGDTNDFAALFYRGNVVSNEAGEDYDFRIEGDTESNLVMVDASTDRVGIGTATPTYRFDIFDPSTISPTLVYRGRNNAATGTRTQIGSVEYFNDQGSTIDFTGGSNFSINLNAAAAYNLQLAVDSAAKPGTNVWTVASDERLKEDINPFKDGLETLKGIEPVYFKYNGKANIKDKHYFVGVVAQQLEEVAPYMVGTFESAPGDIPFEKQEAATKTYKSVDNGAMTYIAINAIKELDQQQTKIKETFKNISDFGVATTTATETFVPFNSEFTSKLNSIPIVTVTAINSEAIITITNQTNEGFTIKMNGDFSATNFNWIAMAKVKEEVLKVDNAYSSTERSTMLNKVKAANETIDYQREYDEIAKRKQEKIAEDKVRKRQYELGKAAENDVKPKDDLVAEEDRKQAEKDYENAKKDSERRAEARKLNDKAEKEHDEELKKEELRMQEEHNQEKK